MPRVPRGRARSPGACGLGIALDGRADKGPPLTSLRPVSYTHLDVYKRQTFWGIHNDALGRELVDEGFVSVGWDAIGDLRRLGNDRTAIKAAVASSYPDAKPGAIPVVAGVLARFAFEMQQGDIVIAPYKPDSTINFGRVSGPYEFHPEVEQHLHRRRAVSYTHLDVYKRQELESSLA